MLRRANTMPAQTSATEEITLITYLRDDSSQFARPIQLSSHDTISDLFTKCAAAWPHAFRSATDVKKVCYVEDVYLIEIVRENAWDLQYLWDMIRRHQIGGQKSKVKIFLWGGSVDGEALVGGIEKLGI